MGFKEEEVAHGTPSSIQRLTMGKSAGSQFKESNSHLSSHLDMSCSLRTINDGSTTPQSTTLRTTNPSS